MVARRPRRRGREEDGRTPLPGRGVSGKGVARVYCLFCLRHFVGTRTGDPQDFLRAGGPGDFRTHFLRAGQAPRATSRSLVPRCTCGAPPATDGAVSQSRRGPRRWTVVSMEHPRRGRGAAATRPRTGHGRGYDPPLGAALLRYGTGSRPVASSPKLTTVGNHWELTLGVDRRGDSGLLQKSRDLPQQPAVAAARNGRPKEKTPTTYKLPAQKTTLRDLPQQLVVVVGDAVLLLHLLRHEVLLRVPPPRRRRRGGRRGRVGGGRGRGAPEEEVRVGEG